MGGTIGGWFIVMTIHFGGVDHPDMSNALAQRFYGSHEGCMADAREFVRKMPVRGVHGRYLCMYHNESDEELQKTRKVNF